MDDESKFKEKLEEALKVARNPEAARSLLACLFPKAEKVLRTYIPNETTESDERNRRQRLSQRDFASTYFGLDPQPISWGLSEIDAILNAENPMNALRTVKERIDSAGEKDRGRLRRLFLGALDGAFGKGRDFTTAWLSALINFSAYFIRSRDETSIDGMFDVDNTQRLRWVILSALRDLAPERRFEMFSSVIPHATDITLLCEVVRSTAGDVRPEGAKGDRDARYFGERTDELRGQLLERVKQLAGLGMLWSQADPTDVLWFWWGGDPDGEVKTFLEAALATDEGLASLLRITISRVRSSAGDYNHVNYSVWSKIVDLDKLASKAREVIAANAREDLRELAIHFLPALERGKKDRL